MTASSAELIRAEVEARILVVDDEPEIAAMVAEALREAEPAWQIEVETDSAAALDRLTGETFDCLITDLVMPEIDGIRLAHKARALDESLALIAITGRASIEGTVDALRAGFADFIQKPLDLEALRQAVGRSIQQARRQAKADRQLEDLAEANATLETSQAQLSQKLDIASHDLVLSSNRMIRQMETVSLVADVARSILGVIEIEDLLGLCAEIIGDRVACQSSTVALHDSRENAVGLMVRAHPAEEDESPTLCWLPAPIRSGILCRAAMTGKSVHVENIGASNLVHAKEREFWREGRLLIVPLPCQNATAAVAVLHRAADDNDFGVHDIKHVTELAQVMGPAIRTAKLHHQQRCQVYATLEGMAQALENRDPFRRGHSTRVIAYVMPIATVLELPPFQIGALQIASHLHDIGLAAVPEAAINHPGPLTPEQWEIVRGHPETSASLLKPLDFLAEVGQIIRAHHESYDGTGYPDRKAGEEIPLVARVIAVADAFDAMTSPRPHREALSLDAALEQVRRLAGEQFDPRAAEALLSIPGDLLAGIQATGR